MNICFFDFTVNFGGAPQGSVFLMKRLKDAGYEVNIIDAFGSSEEYRKKNIDYNLNYHVLYPQKKNVTIGFKDKPIIRTINFLKQTRNFLNVTIKLFNCLKEIKPDVVIVNNEKSLFFLYLVKNLLQFKIVLYFRGEGTSSQLTDMYVHSINKKTDHTVAHSKLAVNNLKKAGVDKKKLSYIPNCIEFYEYKSTIKSKDLLASKRFKVILTAARPVHEKGHHIAIEALNILKKEGYEIDLLFPGTIPMGADNSYINDLKKLIRDYKLNEYVHFIGWRANLIADIVSCDLVVLPSHTEGFPRSVIEAMISGTPVCATPVGGIPEAITHKQTGLIFEVDDAMGLAKCIKELIDDPALYKFISEQAKIFSRKYFSPEENTEGMIRILNNLRV